MRVVLLSGGVGGSRFTQGVIAATSPDDEVTVVANAADDLWLYGLRVCPDLDTLMYTLGGGIDTVRGWGRVDETWQAKDELTAYGASQAWFGLGDRDLATHLVRTQMLRDGLGLTEATRRLCARWAPGTDLGRVALVPMTEDCVETWIATTVDGADADIHFQEFWIRHQAKVPVRSVVYRGVEAASPAPGVLEAINEADVVLLPPSNPIVSVGPILAVPGIREAIRSTTAPVIGLSPVISGRAVRGMADQLLAGLGIDSTAASIARWYGSRTDDGVLDGWLVDESDAHLVDGVGSAGVTARAVPLWMSSPAATRQMAVEALTLAGELRRG